MTEEKSQADMAALARGGRTNFFGFLLRLAARLPFLFIGGRLYGAEELGVFASALVVSELCAMLCSLGEKRGLAQRLSDNEDTADPGHLVYDGMLAALILSALAAIFLWFVPQPLFPSGDYTWVDRLIVLSIPAFALTEIALAAQAYRFDIATTVRARAVVEPWTISILAGLLWFPLPDSGLSVAYLASIYAGLVTALIPFLKSYGLPRGWKPGLRGTVQLTTRALPLASADAIEWGTRRLDLFVLGLFAAPQAVGIYYVAQQVASLPQKLKTSFEPILGPVITRNLKEKNYPAIARQVCQVGFWITAAQAGIALALGIPGEGVMGLVGPSFVGGTGALAFLLGAEVVAATAVVSEAALIYVARVRNLTISIATIGLQGLLTVGAMLLVQRLEWTDNYKAAAAAASLMVALAVASLVKSRVLARILDEPINNWRWALFYAAIPATFVGYGFTRLPEWAELAFGVPAILFVYGWVIWRFGFGPEDRVLFRRNLDSPPPV